jgi:hypothetical protein
MIIHITGCNTSVDLSLYLFAVTYTFVYLQICPETWF